MKFVLAGNSLLLPQITSEQILQVMKLTVLLLIAVSLHVCAYGFTQVITIDEIEQQPVSNPMAALGGKIIGLPDSENINPLKEVDATSIYSSSGVNIKVVITVNYENKHPDTSDYTLWLKTFTLWVILLLNFLSGVCSEFLRCNTIFEYSFSLRLSVLPRFLLMLGIFLLIYTGGINFDDLELIENSYIIMELAGFIFMRRRSLA